MAVVHVPFNFNPASVDLHGTSTYTVPANKFARVLLVPITPAGELYIKKSGGSAEYMTSSVTNNLTGSGNYPSPPYTLYTLASGYTARRTLISASIIASNGTVDFRYAGNIIITIPQNGSNSDSSIVDHTGPGSFTWNVNGAGGVNFSGYTINLKVFRVGEVMPDTPDDTINPANVAGEIWLTDGDEISWQGGLIINEYVKPS